jgi:hypothetical protein
LIFPFIIFLAGIVVLVSQVSIELSETVIKNISITLFILASAASIVSAFLIYKYAVKYAEYANSGIYALGGFFIILFTTFGICTKIIEFITEKYEYGSAVKGGFSTIKEWKTAKSISLDTKEEYEKHIQEQARKRAEQDRIRAEQERAKAEQVEQERLAAEQRCRQDLQCLGEKHFAYATVYCANQIERLAKYDFEWTDKWHERKFSHFKWKNREMGVITYAGDKARFQNAFGAWQPHIYECDIDTKNEEVIDVRARPGRL